MTETTAEATAEATEPAVIALERVRERSRGAGHWLTPREARAATDEIDRLTTELATFRQKVRRLAIQTADDQGWCREGLNDGLHELDLAPYHGGTYHTGTAVLTGTVVRPEGYRGDVLTADTIGSHVAASSGDDDVEITGQQLTGFTPDQRGGGKVTVTVEVTVTGTSQLVIAESWITSALELDWSHRYLQFDDLEVSQVALAERTDPDDPSRY